MFKLWQAKTETETPPDDVTSIGAFVVYAIGDIHGRIDLLRVLLQRIREDMATRSLLESPLLIFLGDYVDRGPASRAVIEQVMALRATHTVVTLRGNHEDTLLRFLDDPSIGPTWMEQGGAQTLLSYGVTPPPRGEADLWMEARDRLAEALPPSHLAFLEGLEHYALIGDYVFAHAGVRPGIPVDQQTTQDLMWIRRPFLAVDKAIDRVVVHGHTPTEEPHMGHWRIGVDTGAYATGVLTAVRLSGTDRAFLSTREAPRPSGQ